MKKEWKKEASFVGFDSTIRLYTEVPDLSDVAGMVNEMEDWLGAKRVSIDGKKISGEIPNKSASEYLTFLRDNPEWTRKSEP